MVTKFCSYDSDGRLISVQGLLYLDDIYKELYEYNQSGLLEKRSFVHVRSRKKEPQQVQQKQAVVVGRQLVLVGLGQEVAERPQGIANIFRLWLETCLQPGTTPVNI